jgi:AcrR family transcriptional regulator
VRAVSTRPTSPVLGARYDKRRQEVLDLAAREFARSGFEETSVQQLSVAIGIAAGGMYHYFAGKEELLVSICDQVMDPLLDEARALEQAGGEPAAQLRELVHLWVAQVCARRDHMRVFQQQRHAVDAGDQWRAVRADRKSFERIVDDTLARAQVAGLLRGDRRLDLAALLGMVNHTAQWYRPRGPLTPDEIADGYADLLLA